MVFNIKRILAYFFDFLRCANSEKYYQNRQITQKRAQNKLIKGSDGTRDQNKRNMKSKFFSQISDHQQSMVPRPLRGVFLILPARLVVADPVMTSPIFKNDKDRFSLASLSLVIFFLLMNACTVKSGFVQPGTIPHPAVPTPGAEDFGNALFLKLCRDYDLDSDSPKHDRLVEVFDQLTKAAEVDHLPWHIYLLTSPEIADIRAVHGNHIFVWSGLLDAVDNDDELAGVLAFELSHTLAYHTVPVEFTLASDVLFRVAELATSLGIIVASQGTVVIGGHGWMKSVYREIADLDPLDREYSEEQEREAADIAFLIIARTQYSPQALLDFWKRVSEDETLYEKYERFSRSLSPRERAVMLENLILQPPEGNHKFVKKPTL